MKLSEEEDSALSATFALQQKNFFKEEVYPMPTLREYQMEDVKKLNEDIVGAKGIFNEQRTGKTPTSLVAMEQRGVKRLLIVCPASLCYRWAEECETWLGKKAVVIRSAKVFHEEGADLTAPVWIINYENLRTKNVRKTTSDIIMRTYKPDGLIVDEAHRCKDIRSLNFRAVNQLIKIPNRFYLTGTPAPNKQEEVYALLHFINPTRFTAYWAFIEEFFDILLVWRGCNQVREIGRLKRGKLQELQHLLLEHGIMRKRKEVMPWLPKMEAPTRVRLDCTPMQLKYLKELEETFETEDIICEGVLDRIAKVRQICNAPSTVNLRGSSPKIDYILQYLKDYPNKQILLFSNSTKMLRLLEGNIGGNIIIGNTPLEHRHLLIKRFQDGLIKVLGIQTQAGKEGLTLYKADVTIFIDVYPPVADYLQAKDRMVPVIPDTIKPQEIIHLMMKGTYDEHLYHIVENNIKDVDVINDYISYMNERRNNGTNNQQ